VQPDLVRWLVWGICRSTPNLPLADGAITFFDEHYRREYKKVPGKELDDDGKLVIFPGTAGENLQLAIDTWHHGVERPSRISYIGLH